jgi:hypothetical protein
MEPHWITDPGHAWLVVPMRDVVESGISPSPWSYISDDGHWAFLEEDADAPAFLKATGQDPPTMVVNVRTTWRRPDRNFPAR